MFIIDTWERKYVRFHPVFTSYIYVFEIEILRFDFFSNLLKVRYPWHKHKATLLVRKWVRGWWVKVAAIDARSITRHSLFKQRRNTSVQPSKLKRKIWGCTFGTPCLCIVRLLFLMKLINFTKISDSVRTWSPPRFVLSIMWWSNKTPFQNWFIHLDNILYFYSMINANFTNFKCNIAIKVSK